MSSDVEALLRDGRIEVVEADRSAAGDKLEESKLHLHSATLIAETDPAGAYALLYDAARKAIDAHMLASGYRVSKSRLGAHEATARYASSGLGEDARHFGCGGIGIGPSTAPGKSADRRWRPTFDTRTAS